MTIPALPSLDRTSTTFRADLDSFFLTQLPDTVDALNAEFTRIDGITAVGFTGTSGSSRTITSSGSFTFSVASGTTKAFTVGQRLAIAASSAPSNQMRGYITAYTPGTGDLVVAVDESSGGGTFDLWSIAVTAPAASPYYVGDVLVTTRVMPAPEWLPADGAIYAQTSYYELFSELGLLRNGVLEPFGIGFTLAASAVPYYSNGRYMQRAGHHCFYAGTSSTTNHTFYRTVNGVTAVSNTTLPALAGSALYALGGQNSTCILMVPPNGNAWVARSTDEGATFATINIGGLADPSALLVVNDTFVLTTTTTTYYTSLDGVSWATRTLPALGTFTVANNLLVIGVSVSATHYTTPDGINWTTRTLPYTSVSGAPIFVYKDGVWLSYAESTAGLARSTDNCATWASVNPVLGSGVLFGASGACKVVVFNGRFVMGHGSGSTACIYQSADGLSWGQVPFPSRIWNSATANNLFVVGQELVWLGTDTINSFVYTTSDLMTWQAVSQVAVAPLAAYWANTAELNDVQICIPGDGTAAFYRRPVYTYDTATQFVVPLVPATVNTYIKA